MQELVEIDNTVQSIDVFGSWVEIGMVGVALLAGILLGVPAIHAMIQSRKNKKDKVVTKDFVRTHTRINEYLTEARVLLDCARTQVVQFHNGGEYINGVSMKKLSMTHESVTDGITDTQQETQDAHISLYAEKVEAVLNNNSKPQLTSSLKPSFFKRTLETNRVLLFCVLPLRDLNKNKTIGCVTAQWCSWEKVDDVDYIEVSRKMEETRKLIEGQLQKAQ